MNFAQSIQFLFSLVFYGVISLPCLAVEVLLDRDIMVDTKKFLAERTVEDVKFYGGEHSRRDVIEVVLFQQALKWGGYDKPLEMKPEDSYKRIVHKIAMGESLASAPLIWLEDVIPSRMYVSEAIVREGEFLVGLYGRSDNKTAMRVKTIKDVSQLTAVSNQQWRSDWRTLQSMQFSWVYDYKLWPMMVKMVWAERVDFTLAPFQPTSDMSLTVEGLTLVPVPNVRVALSGSRHWVLSKRHPEGVAAYKALQQGVAKMRAEGLIEKAYIESGFFDQRVAHWPIINHTKGDE